MNGGKFFYKRICEIQVLHEYLGDDNEIGHLR